MSPGILPGDPGTDPEPTGSGLLGAPGAGQSGPDDPNEAGASCSAVSELELVFKSFSASDRRRLSGRNTGHLSFRALEPETSRTSGSCSSLRVWSEGAEPKVKVLVLLVQLHTLTYGHEWLLP